MPLEALPAERPIHDTTSLCRVCKNGVSARVVATASGEVWMRKTCPTHGAQQVRLSTSAAWYESTRPALPPPAPPRTIRREVEHGCPFDCGPCASHQQRIRLPVVTITSACNLDCPKCYVHNKNEEAYHMEPAEFARILDHLKAEHGGDLDIINLTGGEPTVHPRFLEFLRLARDAGVHRVTICTNGIRLARDEALVEKLAELGARIALSFDTFERAPDLALQGAHLVGLKLRCLDLLEKHDVDTTLIPVMTRGVNDTEIGRIIRLGLERPNIRHLEIHTITYTGQGGSTYDRSGRMSMFEVLEAITATTDGLLGPDDFVSSPCAHPLCYQIAYMLVDPDGGPPVPFTRFLSREALRGALADRLYIEPSPALEAAVQDAVDRLWVERPAGADRMLGLLRRLLDAVFPRRAVSRAESLRASERAVKAIYVHSHMDEETFDTERAMQCCDSNCYADGATIPVCNYNVLYREKEARFNRHPLAWNERRGGQRAFPLPVVPAHHR
jgi:uncharacterized radical SAM superfamily Fe-S cluster-containing enzyme